MFSKKLSRSAVSVLGWVFFFSLCIGIPGAIASDPPLVCPDECDNNEEFTAEFRLQDCWYFKHIGKNPYFNLMPGLKSSFRTPEPPEGPEDREEAEITVLCDTKWINFDGRWIKTRVVEERAYEENEEEDLVLTEISLNWFAICKKTNAVYYFGEDSRDCSVERGGFDPNDETKCLRPEPPDPDDGLFAAEGDDEDLDPDTAGSWEAGVDGARPGLIMPGTWLLNAKYFQEWSPKEDIDDSACDRGENKEMGLTADNPRGGEFTDCVMVIDTNPVEEVCGDDDAKIYCPGVGLVEDGDLKLVSYGFVGCDDDDHYKRWKWSWRYGHRRF